MGSPSLCAFEVQFPRMLIVRMHSHQSSMDEMKDVEDDMSAEPWIDHNDPEYWREIIKQDLSMAKVVLKSQKYYISGFKCYNAAEKILSCWFVERNSVNDLPRSLA